MTYLVAGLVVGSVYAIATLGIVLTYSSTRIFNFAQGAIAFALAVTFYELSVTHGWNPRLAAAVTILVISPLVGLALWAVLFRRLASAPTSVRLVSTIGLWVALPPLVGPGLRTRATASTDRTRCSSHPTSTRCSGWGSTRTTSR